MTVRLLVTAAFAATLVTASGANAFSGPRGTEIQPLNNAVFEVGARGSGISDYLWCGAASYARKVLKAGWQSMFGAARSVQVKALRP